MTPYPLKEIATKPKGGQITHTMADGSVREYSDVRIGLVWPSPLSPAYYCVMGEEYLGIYIDPKNPFRRGMVHQIAEKEFRMLSIERLCSGLFDDALLYGARTVYCDLDEEHAEYYDAMREHGYRHKLRGPRFEDAPFKKNFQAGLAQVQDWREAGLLSLDTGGLAYEQTRGMNNQMLQKPDADLTYFASNALRFVISGFYKYRPTCYRKTESWRDRKGRRRVAR